MLNLAQLRERRENGEKGFTLIELLVVVVIIGILVAIAIPVYLNYTKGAADKAAESDLRNAVSALEQCQSENSTYPSQKSSDTEPGVTGCDAKLNSSDNTLLRYRVNGLGSAYNLRAYANNGKGKYWCYASEQGGKIVSTSTATWGDGYFTACPS